MFSSKKTGFFLMEYGHPISLIGLYFVLVGCGLTYHSEIFQLYSDGTVVQFSKF